MGTKFNVIFQPLSAVVTIRTSGSTLSQEYDADLNAFIPTRTLVPTTVIPSVVILDPDGLVSDGNKNGMLVTESIKWYKNSITPANEIGSGDTAYEIDRIGLNHLGQPDATQKGKITVKRNFAVTEPTTLIFTATFADMAGSTVRRQISVIEDVTFTTSTKAMGVLEVDIETVGGSVFNPLKNRKFLMMKAELKRGTQILPAHYWWYKKTGTTEVLLGSNYRGYNTDTIYIPTGEIGDKQNYIVKSKVKIGSEARPSTPTGEVAFDTELLFAEYPKYTWKLVTEYGDADNINVPADAKSVRVWIQFDTNEGSLTSEEASLYWIVEWKSGVFGIERTFTMAELMALPNQELKPTIIEEIGLAGPPKEMQSVKALPSVEVGKGTSFSDIPLPQTVEVTLVGGTKYNSFINWDKGTYKAGVVGSYTLSGELGVSFGIVNKVPPLKASVSVVVKETAFMLSVDTRKVGSTSTKIELGLSETAYYNFKVEDWGDGTSETFVGLGSTLGGKFGHTYATVGNYQIKISSATNEFDLYMYQGLDRLKIISLDNWGTMEWRTLRLMFDGCSNMVAKYTDTPNTVNVTDFVATFRGCTLFNGNVDFNVDGGNLNEMLGRSGFNRSLANLNIESVTNLRGICTVTDINVEGTTTNYDDTLVSWGNQNAPLNMTIDFGASKYSARGKVGRDKLIGKGSTITDGGLTTVIPDPEPPVGVNENLILSEGRTFDINVSAAHNQMLPFTESRTVESLKGEYVTLSFDAKSSEGTQKVRISLGAGTGARVWLTLPADQFLPTTSWAHYKFTVLVSSGSTLDSVLCATGYQGGATSGTVNIRDLKLEIGEGETRGDGTVDPPLGVELIVNPHDRNFTQDTGFWELDVEWSIIDGKAVKVNKAENGLISIPSFMTIGQSYEVEIDVTELDGRILFYSTDFDNTPAEREIKLGVHKYIVTAKTLDFKIQAFRSTASINSISIKEAPLTTA